MGDIVRPKVPQWEKLVAVEVNSTDRVAHIAKRALNILSEEEDPIVVWLAALQLAQNALVDLYAEAMGRVSADEARKQSQELAAQYASVTKEPV